ncbi:MAG: hypothetical protein AB4058_19060 [Microcystaceae cyanobacterium]
MAYSEFKTILQVQEQFGLEIEEHQNLFRDIKPREISSYLKQTIDENLIIANAVNTEKARSELLITPILLEVRRMLEQKISFFSGTELTVDLSQGLSGYCDYILTASSEIYEIRCPIITLVEAKNENIKGGLGQCMAEMLAAQIFNQKDGLNLNIYGVVTTGIIWKFLKLTDKLVYIDIKEYYINQLKQILGILASPFLEYYDG